MWLHRRWWKFAAVVALHLYRSCDGWQDSVLASAEPACADLIKNHVERISSMSESELGDAAQILRKAVDAMDLPSASACAEAAMELGASHALGAAYLAEQVATRADCLSDFDTKSSVQTRCAQRWYKIAIHSLRVGNLADAADKMWQRAVSVTSAGGSKKHIGWPSVSQTPTVWIDGLTSKPFWDCSSFGFVKTLEEAAPQILREIEGFSDSFATAYPYLTRGGTWQNLFPFRGHEWNSTVCAAMPFTCQLLMPELPTKPHVPYLTTYNEEIVIFRSKPGASVGEHCGSSNNVINLHLTLSGGKGTFLKVGGKSTPLSDGKTVCFDDSFFHSMMHSNESAQERISIVVRVMHPEMTLAKYGDAKQTDIVDLTSWNPEAEVERAVDRLRTQHRRLMSAASGRKSVEAGNGKREDL